mgnify:CR=1 FL=1
MSVFIPSCYWEAFTTLAPVTTMGSTWHRWPGVIQLGEVLTARVSRLDSAEDYWDDGKPIVTLYFHDDVASILDNLSGVFVVIDADCSGIVLHCCGDVDSLVVLKLSLPS